MDQTQRTPVGAADVVLTHEFLKEVFLKAMGGKVPMAARPSWANFLRGKELRFTFRYLWILHPGFYVWVSEHPRLEMEDGAEWFGVVEISAT